jgi:hypothetical protein
MRVTEEKMKLFEEDFLRFKERTTDLKRTSLKKTAAASSTVEFSQSSSSNCAEASSLYIDVYLPRPSSASAVNPLAASLLEPQAGFIRCELSHLRACVVGSVADPDPVAWKLTTICK